MRHPTLDASRRLAAGLVVVALAASATVAAASENLLYNGEFDVALQGYQWAGNAPGGWTAFDSDLCIGSGAFYGSRSGASATPVVLRSSECIRVTPGDPLHFAARYSSDADFTIVILTFWEDPSCTGPPAGQQWGNAPSTGGSWQSLTVETAVPADKVALTVQVESQSAAGLTTAVDRVYVGPSPRLFADDFEAQALCRWSAAMP